MSRSPGEPLPEAEAEQDAVDYLMGGLDLSAYASHALGEVVSEAWRWWVALYQQGVQAPLFLVLDLGRLFLEGEAFRFRGMLQMDSPGGEQEQVARQLYEERVLFRRLGEPLFYRVFQILHHLAPVLRGRALVLLLRRLLASWSESPDRLPAPMGEALGLVVTRGRGSLLREGERGAQPQAARRRLEGRQRDPHLFLRLLQDVHQWAAEHLDLDRQLHQEDLYELEHVDLFESESLRVMARDVKRLQAAIPPLFLGPRWERAHGVPEQGLMHAVGAYPTGGFAELTTRGSFESLLPSELLYWEPQAELDVFRLRWVEDQLLYYLRDESSLRLMRLGFEFLLLEEDLHSPFGVGRPKARNVLRGFVAGLVEDLSRVLDRDDVRFRVTLVGRQVDQATVAVLRLLFHEKVEQERLVVEWREEAPDWERWALERAAPDRRVTLLVMGSCQRLQGALTAASHPPALLRWVFLPVRLGFHPAATEPEPGVHPLCLHPEVDLGAALGDLRDAVVREVV